MLPSEQISVNKSTFHRFGASWAICMLSTKWVFWHGFYPWIVVYRDKDSRFLWKKNSFFHYVLAETGIWLSLLVLFAQLWSFTDSWMAFFNTLIHFYLPSAAFSSSLYMIYSEQVVSSLVPPVETKCFKAWNKLFQVMKLLGTTVDFVHMTARFNSLDRISCSDWPVRSKGIISFFSQ